MDGEFIPALIYPRVREPGFLDHRERIAAYLKRNTRPNFHYRCPFCTSNLGESLFLGGEEVRCPGCSARFLLDVLTLKWMAVPGTTVRPVGGNNDQTRLEVRGGDVSSSRVAQGRVFARSPGRLRSRAHLRGVPLFEPQSRVGADWTKESNFPHRVVAEPQIEICRRCCFVWSGRERECMVCGLAVGRGHDLSVAG